MMAFVDGDSVIECLAKETAKDFPEDTVQLVCPVFTLPSLYAGSHSGNYEKKGPTAKSYVAVH